MRFRGCFLAAVFAVLAIPAGAGAATTVTIGNVTPPANSTGAMPCPAPPDQIVAANTQNGFVPAYVVPGGDGALLLTQWQLDATGATAGAQVTLVVMNVDFTAGTVSVVATDTEALNPVGLPANGVETFTPANPIEVQPGDVIALYLGNSTGIPCYWTGAPSVDGISGLVVTNPPAAGQTVSPTNDQTGAAIAPDAALNLGATLTPLSYDAAVSMSAGPSSALVGQTAVLTATITNKGPDAGPITLTDTVPAGLTVDYAAAASGSCTVSGSTVTCLFGSVAVGQSENAAIVVTPNAAKTFTDSGSVADDEGATDPNSANNNATTTLRVSAVAVPKCVVPKLGGASESLAKTLLSLLDCKVGKVKTAKSKSVAKGDLISTSPGAGSYAAGKSIGMTVSSGKPKPKPKKKKKKK
jgi:uncharacterized repeat protein (TIGR01451 family)